MMLVFVLCIAFVFSSCSKDDDEGASVPSGLVGTWFHDNGNWTYTLTFNSNGTFSQSKSARSGSTGGAKGVYKVSGTKVICTGSSWTVYFNGEVDSDDNYSMEYTYSNGKLNDGDYTKR